MAPVDRPLIKNLPMMRPDWYPALQAWEDVLAMMPRGKSPVQALQADLDQLAKDLMDLATMDLQQAGEDLATFGMSVMVTPGPSFSMKSVPPRTFLKSTP